MPWTALSLTVAARAAEPLSDALLAAGAESVALEAAGRGWARQRLSALLAPHADARAALAAAARAAGLARAPRCRVSRLADADWVRRSRAQFGPLRAGRRLWIVPSWRARPAAARRKGALVLRLDPGLAFGTGSHPSTRLALGFLERALGGGERVLDYGCGSGILAIAAARLGAAAVDAVDLDPRALAATMANARANRAAVRACSPQALGAGTYDVVVANILAQPLIELAPRLARRTRRRGRLALAGVLAAQAGAVRAAYAARFRTRIAAREADWVLIEAVRR